MELGHNRRKEVGLGERTRRKKKGGGVRRKKEMIGEGGGKEGRKHGMKVS